MTIKKSALDCLGSISLYEEDASLMWCEKYRLELDWDNNHPCHTIRGTKNYSDAANSEAASFAREISSHRLAWSSESAGRWTAELT